MNRDDVVSDDSRLQALVEKLATRFDMNRVLDEQALEFERRREWTIRVLRRMAA